MKAVVFVGSLSKPFSPAVCVPMAKNKQAKESQDNPQALSAASLNGDPTVHEVLELSSVGAGISVDSVARYFGGNRYKPDAQTAARIQHCIQAASRLATPRATYSLHKVSQAISETQLMLANGTRISVPECLEASASQLVGIVVGTLGADLEKHCRDLAARGEVYQSTLFDAVGTATLDLLTEEVSRIIAHKGASSGLAPGPRFAPGIDGYPLEHQHLLFQIADHTSIGVSLNSSAIMVPAKSISFFQTLLLRAGPTKRLKNKCSQCRMADCQYRMAHTTKDP